MRRLVCLLLALAPSAAACPAYLPAGALPALPVGARGDLRLFAVTAGADGVRRWTAEPLQVDPLDEEGVLLPAPEDGTPLMRAAVAKGDRLNLITEGFGPPAALADGAPCQARSAVTLIDPTAPGRTAYLVACTAPPPAPESPVKHVPAKLTMSSPRYDYEYLPENQLLYRRFTARPSRGGPLLAASDAELAMHFDVKGFFTMDFGNSDIESYVQQTTGGAVGTLASIDFYLRLLFFKINLKMATTVGFYADSAHIPMRIDVPLDASAHLHPASGLLYAWVRRAATIDQAHPERTMPNADATLVLAGSAALAKQGGRYCKGELCTFRLRGAVGSDAFGIDMLVPKVMVDHGFYPQWVGDVAAFKKALAWDDEPAVVKDQVAIYFDNSGLPQGTYRTDQWIHVGTATAVAAGCPAPVKVAGPFTFGAAAH